MHFCFMNTWVAAPVSETMNLKTVHILIKFNKIVAK